MFQGEVRLKVGVWDKDNESQDDEVDFLKQDIVTRANSWKKTYTLSARTTLV